MSDRTLNRSYQVIDAQTTAFEKYHESLPPGHRPNHSQQFLALLGRLAESPTGLRVGEIDVTRPEFRARADRKSFLKKFEDLNCAYSGVPLFLDSHTAEPGSVVVSLFIFSQLTELISPILISFRPTENTHLLHISRNIRYLLPVL